MKSGGRAAGFTIVETMIVLAISAALLVAMMGMVVGQQAKARYKNSITAVTSDIESYIAQVASGRTVEQGGRNCTAALNSGPRLDNATTIALGTKEQCTFLGRAIMFGTNGSNRSDAQQYVVHLLAGNRLSGGDNPMTLADLHLRAMATDGARNWPNMGETRSLQFGTEILFMRDQNNNPIAGFAIITPPSSNGSDLGTIVPKIYPIGCVSTNCEKGLSPEEGVRAIEVALSNNTTVARGAKLCFVSGGSNQSSLVEVGKGGSNASITTTGYNSRNCS